MGTDATNVLRARRDAVHVEYLCYALKPFEIHYDFRPYISGSTRAKLNQKQLNRAKLLVPSTSPSRSGLRGFLHAADTVAGQASRVHR